MNQDYYETLQVHPRADAPAIEAAYNRLINLYDAQRLEGAADELIALARAKRDQIEHAYAVLRDPVRRAHYDAEHAAFVADTRAFTNSVRAQDDQLSLADDTDQEVLDYRPLPPAKRIERVRGFEESARTSARRQQGRRLQHIDTHPWVMPVGLLVVIALVVATSFLLTDGGGPTAALATPTPSQFDIFEAAIPQAQLAAQQNPTNAEAWIDLGNLLYDSTQIVREIAPDSPLYQQRVGRWLEATEAYSQALALDPNNASVRADMGVSACFYGAGTNNPVYVRTGTAEVEQAAQIAPQDERVLYSLGNCLVSAQPPQTDAAIKVWQQIVDQNPTSQMAGQAQLMIAKYSGQ